MALGFSQGLLGGLRTFGQGGDMPADPNQRNVMQQYGVTNPLLQQFGQSVGMLVGRDMRSNADIQKATVAPLLAKVMQERDPQKLREIAGQLSNVDPKTALQVAQMADKLESDAAAAVREANKPTVLPEGSLLLGPDNKVIAKNVRDTKEGANGLQSAGTPYTSKSTGKDYVFQQFKDGTTRLLDVTTNKVVSPEETPKDLRTLSESLLWERSAAKVSGEEQTDWNTSKGKLLDNYSAVLATERNANKLLDLATKVKTGGLSSQIAEIQQYFGVAPKSVGEFNAFMVNQLLQDAKKLGVNPTDYDAKTLQTKLPSLAQSQDVNVALLTQIVQDAQRARRQADWLSENPEADRATYIKWLKEQEATSKEKEQIEETYGYTEQDIQYTMQLHGKTRKQVLEVLKKKPKN